MKIRVTTPFAGFYQSFYESELENLEDLVGEKQANFIDATMDMTVFNNAIAERYISFLNGKLEDFFKVPALLSEPIVHPMTMQNTGDEVSAVLAYSILPSLDELESMASGVVDFKQLLITIAKDKFTSCSGFASFYSPNISPYFDKPYVEWSFPYLTCLLYAMVAVIGYDEGLHNHTIEEWQAAHYDLELHLFALDFLQTSGGVAEIAEASIPSTVTGENRE